MQQILVPYLLQESHGLEYASLRGLQYSEIPECFWTKATRGLRSETGVICNGVISNCKCRSPLEWQMATKKVQVHTHGPKRPPGNTKNHKNECCCLSYRGPTNEY